jgi:AraC-like DNA-binding protein
MVQHSDFTSPHQPNGIRLELPNPSFPGRRPLLRGRQASLSCDTTRILTLEEHCHEQFQLTFHFPPAVGILAQRVAGELREQRVTGRTVSCVGPQVPHICRWESESPLLIAYYEREFIAQFPDADVAAVLAREVQHSAVQDEVLWLLASTLRQLCDERGDPDISLLETIMLALGRRFFICHGQHAPQSNRGAWLSPERLKTVLGHIQANLDKRIRVKQLGQLVSLGTAHFTEVFGNTTGLPPMQYVRESRFIRAHEMAFGCEHRFGEIADACGFSDVSHLNREFKKFFGYPARLLRYRWTAASDSEKS